MESLTKNKQSEDIIIKMASTAFKDHKVTSIEELKQGYFNVAYLIKLSDGQEVILKIAPKQNTLIMTYEKNIMQTEVETMRMVKQQTDVPVAEVLYYDHSHTLCEADYFFMSKLEGESYFSLKNQLSDEEKSYIDYQLGQFNAKINLIKGEKFGYYGQPQKQGLNWHQTFSTIIEDTLKDGEALNIDIGIEYNAVQALLAKYKSAFDEVTMPCLVHWDLWAGNVFIKDGKISGIIDFERCLWADKFMECGFRSHSVEKDFYKGYGITTLTKNEEIRIYWYALYLDLVMTVECDYRQYESNDQYIKSKQKLANAFEFLNECI
jgi:aminoglycoside phosphotransferase (APT) family kinase protein